MKLKKSTFEDLIGNVADDAKLAFDEVLEREKTNKKNSPLTAVSSLTGGLGGVPDLGGVAGIGGGGVGGVPDLGGVTVLAGAAGNPLDAIGGLAALPGQIAELSALISTLLAALPALTGTLGAAGGAAGAAGALVPKK